MVYVYANVIRTKLIQKLVLVPQCVPSFMLFQGHIKNTPKGPWTTSLT